jgi:NAD(P)H-dependent FMN reductase
MDEKIKIKIIIGSIRDGRFGERPANWINEELKKWDGIDVELLDLKDYPMPLFDSAIPPSGLKMKYPDENVQKWSAKVNDGDAFIIITPEYNYGYPSSLKNAIDWLFPEWARKAVGFISYGSVGGGRAAEQLRIVALGVKLVPINRGIYISWEYLMKAMNDKSLSNADLFAPLRNRAGSDQLAIFMDDLLWMAKALKAARKA